MIHGSCWGRYLLCFPTDLDVCPFSETAFEGSAPVEGNLAPTMLRASLELSVLEMQLSTYLSSPLLAVDVVQGVEGLSNEAPD